MNQRPATRVKICGITRVKDAQAAALAGADALGLVFYPPSSRSLDFRQATALLREWPPLVTSVGLFLDPEPAWVQAVLERLPLDVLQFHGGETPEFCASFRRPYIKAVPMADGVDLADFAGRFDSAQALLLDSHGKGGSGGSGRVFDWGSVPSGLPKPLIVAGGLTAGNVAEAVSRIRPWAVDVSSGVERSRGIKDPHLIAEFMRGVRRGECSSGCAD